MARASDLAKAARIKVAASARQAAAAMVSAAAALGHDGTALGESACRDYEVLMAASKNEEWNDDIGVSPEFFAPYST